MTEELLEQFKIAHIRRSKAGTLSGGERRRLEIARCLVSDPRIIMLDEPFAGIDPVTVQNIQLVIKELAQTGISVLITDHAAREILQITDRTYVVSEGRILCSGTAEEIVAHDEVKRKYLGEIEMPTTKVESRARTEDFSPADNSKQPSRTQASMKTSVDFKRQSAPPASPRSAVKIRTDPVAAESAAPLENSESEAEPDILSMVAAVNQAIDRQSEAPADKQSERPKIVFSKPRRSTRKVVSPFKSNDLD